MSHKRNRIFGLPLFAHVVMALVVGTATVANAVAANASDSLKPPFNVEAQRHIHGKHYKDLSCPKPPGVVVDLDFGRSDTDAHAGSEAGNSTHKEEYARVTKVVYRYQRKLGEVSDRYVRHQPASRKLAECTVGYLLAWAEKGALLGKISEPGRYVRSKVLAAVAVSYLKVSDAMEQEAEARAVILAWIRQWAESVREDFQPDPERTSRRSHHMFWAAWSVMSAAIALDDRNLFDWSVERYHSAVDQIEDDGTLPLEMERGKGALYFHLFSVAPLVMIAEAAAWNDMDLYSAQNGALHRLVRRTLEGLEDPSYFEEKTGLEQKQLRKFDGPRIAWMEAYFGRHPDPTGQKWMRTFRPLKSPALGGDMTLLFSKGGRRG